MRKNIVLLIVLLWAFAPVMAQLRYANDQIQTGAERTDQYLPLLKNKRIGVVANPTSVIGSTHLVDSLLSLGIEVVKAFGPEHGFRGNASNGTVVGDEVDAKTTIKIISLYGQKKKPSPQDLADLDVLIFDIQDVGCRFYTNINTLRDVMEACAENGKELLILDRPNPNAYLIDGPILDMRLKSGIGQFPVPIAHGMTIGEFAQMINGEGWLPNNLQCSLQIIPVSNYNHDMLYKLPVPPSPNLNTPESILLYPSTCLFEGLALNHGRGTDFPFTRMGGPMLKGTYEFSFVPISMPGRAEDPVFQDEVCYGIDLLSVSLEKIVSEKKINLKWMMELYKNYPDQTKFFDRSISRQIGNIDFLAGTYEFRKQIERGASEDEIRASWEPGLSNYKEMRKKYLLYP